MKPRHGKRLVEKVRANALLCGVPLAEWHDMTREDRKKRLEKAKRPTKRRARKR